MDLADAVRIACQAGEMGVATIAISGGEAVTWEGILPLLNVISQSPMKLSLYSSGVGDQMPAVIELMSNIPGARLIFSVFSHQPKVHEQITQAQGSHRTTIEAIKLAAKLGICTEIHFTAMGSNYRDLLGVCELAKTLGVSMVSMLRLVPQGRSRTVSDCRLLRYGENLQLQQLVSTARSIIKIRLGSPYGFLHISDSPQCMAGVNRLIVLPDLKISPCDAFKQVNPNELTGTDTYSRLDKWSLSECWEKSPYLDAIRKHLREPHVAPCNDCTFLNQCFSGCTAQRFLVEGKLVRAPDPMCIMGDHGKS
jgi:radical SAM protein with 4Fe4S-binding SPASM domain